MHNASSLVGGCRQLFNGCYDAHVVGGACEEFTGQGGAGYPRCRLTPG